MTTANQKRRKAQLGKRNSNFKKGFAVNSDGYITLMSGRRGGNGRKLQHRVIARAIKGTKVHHENHNRKDNKRANLKVTKKHSGVGGK